MSDLITTRGSNLVVIGGHARYRIVPSIDEVSADLSRLTGMGTRLHWAIGYVFTHGMELYGEDMGQILDAVQYEPRYLGNIAYVSRNVPECNRDFALSWSHFQVAAAVKDVDDQYSLLALAVENRWSVREFAEHCQVVNDVNPVSVRYPPAPKGDREAIHLLLNFIKGHSKFKEGDLIDVIQKYITG